MVQLRHGAFVTTKWLICVVCTLVLLSTTDMASKYLFSCHNKLSNSLSILDPLKVLGSGTYTLGASKVRHPRCLQPSCTGPSCPSTHLLDPAAWIAQPSLCSQRLPSLFCYLCLPPH
ncbi:hypothetical protein AMTRI_Chr01g133090 [Amborella trichopoda]